MNNQIHNGGTMLVQNEFIKLNPNNYYCDIWMAKGKAQITGFYKQGILELLEANGFAKTSEGLVVRSINNIVTEVGLVGVHQFIKDYIYELPQQIQFSLEQQIFIEKSENLRNLFLEQSHLIVNNSFFNNLPMIKTTQLKDTLHNIRLPFKNGIVNINSEKYKLVPYRNLEKHHIFKEQIIEHEISNMHDQQSQFEKFIYNISDGDPKTIETFESAIGYLIHNYRDSANNKLVLCYDLEVSEGGAFMGGTGKGIFVTAIGHVRKSTSINGKKFDGRDKFAFQEVTPSTQLVILQDINPSFQIERLNSLVTDGFSVEQKNRQSYTIKPEHAPKIIITSNVILQYKGTTNMRRQIILQFGNYYSNKVKKKVEEPIVREHGSRFFEGWDEAEWNRFYQYMIKCGMNYLKNGLKLMSLENIARNKLIQDTSSEFVSWIEKKKLEPNKPYSVNELFDEFKSLYCSEDFEQRHFSNWLKEYAASIGYRIHFEKGKGIGTRQFILS